MKPVDAHCHLDFDRFESDREEVIERAKERLEFVVNAGSNLDHNRAALELQRQHPAFMVANLGLHPTYVSDFGQLERIKKQIREEDPVAIGEIGLDHHHVTGDQERERQKEVFKEMLKLAEELEKPVVVHSREAEQKAVEILSRYSLPGIMLHCFNGEPGLAVEAAGKGMKIGVTTQVLYSSRVQEIVEEVALEDMLLETDSPFLYRGERNEPANVVESAGRIAEIKGVEEEKVVSETTRNARQLFRS